MSFLIDTDIIIYSLKNHPTVMENFQVYEKTPKSLSVITFGELIYGAHKSAHSEKNLANVRRLSEIFPLLPVSPAIMETFGLLKAHLNKIGMVVADMDLLIGSTAITHNLILVTNNVRHFEKIPDLSIQNWAVSQ